ncbi:MAG: transketolase [Pseudomonadales bacterium]|nr:transketolase [Pseudomonadales bacterium]
MSTKINRANAIRALAMDAVEKAQSGHPGAPMGLAEVAEILWCEILAHNPVNPKWINRDRMVLSNGHASMLLYAVLHLSGYAVSIEDIKRFRQLGSITAGHPELDECPGVETTTGPLGQGLANAVGMAIAEMSLARTFNQKDHKIVDHHTWAIVGDGCLMEGISHEVASLAGTLGLGKLNVLYDDNGISIDGNIQGWFTEDVAARFEAYGWQVIRAVDGHDVVELRQAMETARKELHRPTLVCCRTVIGYGAPSVQGTSKTHGAPLGTDEIIATRKALAWNHEAFDIPEEMYEAWDCQEAGQALEDAWNEKFERYSHEYPVLAAELLRRMQGKLPEGWDLQLQKYAREQQADPEPLATRMSSLNCLNLIGPALPELLGGSADLTGSVGTRWGQAKTLDVSEPGNYLNYGVREFGMSAIGNGIALHGGFIPYSGTFLVFMDYAKNAVRLAALMKKRNIFVYTHDSVALGEDGPTHQPVEQLVALRTTPNMSVWRPCDSVETAFAWEAAISREDGPTAIVLTRQKTQPQKRDELVFGQIAKGAYILVEAQHTLKLIIIATGSEVGIACQAAQSLTDSGIGVRVVSMPCADIFLNQMAEYQEEVLPSAIRSRVVVEAAQSDYWYRFAGLDGRVVGIDRFGLSAPGDVAMRELNISTEAIITAAQELI